VARQTSWPESYDRITAVGNKNADSKNRSTGTENLNIEVENCIAAVANSNAGSKNAATGAAKP